MLKPITLRCMLSLLCSNPNSSGVASTGCLGQASAPLDQARAQENATVERVERVYFPA